MEVKGIFKAALFILSVICLAGCTKEEWDAEDEETEYSTVVDGTILTSGGMPVSDVVVKVDYVESLGFHYVKTRHKAEVKTDKNGKYRLFFQIKDDERETDDGKDGTFKSYSLIFDMKELNPKEYILPGDLMATVISLEPPVAKLTEDVLPDIRYGCSFDSGRTYTENLYIPSKRYVRVTLKGFVPRQQNNSFDFFTVYTSFPYGGESTDFVFPGTNYSCGVINDYLFALYADEEKTFDVPFALNENNIITLVRRKDGVYSTEKHQLFVTGNSPENLTFEY